MVAVPTAEALGFKHGHGGVHDSRTIMLAEQRRLLAVCPASADLEQYREAVVEENVLLKGSQEARRGASMGDTSSWTMPSA